ncbi:MAG TPA: hypothetical protein VFO29_08800 [Candidatus Rubrimentiphilum sp.]|nr:hypothetical protein [Candidatus Rubrimentiphilum sp.]
MATTESDQVISLRLSPEILDLVDRAAERDFRSRSNLIKTHLARTLDFSRPADVIRRITESFYHEQINFGMTQHLEEIRAQLAGAKWMLTTLLGEQVKEEVLNRVRHQTEKAIPSVVPLSSDGNRYGVDLDAG